MKRVLHPQTRKKEEEKQKAKKIIEEKKTKPCFPKKSHDDKKRKRNKSFILLTEHTQWSASSETFRKLLGVKKNWKKNSDFGTKNKSFRPKGHTTVLLSSFKP